MEIERLLDIIEYERQLSEALNRAKQEAVAIVEQAKQSAKELPEQEKLKISLSDKQCEEKLAIELQQQKIIILQEKEEKLRQIENIPEKKIEDLVKFALNKIAGI